MSVEGLTFVEHLGRGGYGDCILIVKAISRETSNSKMHRLSNCWITNLASH